ncbi:hypothetical protein EC968_008424 [Mortierella alpina]|nr:hypothetical protein EC968_008424 [Mortierella alpina]
MAVDNKPTTHSADSAASPDVDVDDHDTRAHSRRHNSGSSSSRSIFSVTVDPNALEQELDQAAQALHSTVNSLLNTMQSSVFGGLDTLSREMSALERNSKSFLEDCQHPLNAVQNRFPWSFRTDGPKKRYRITIEELPPLEPGQVEEEGGEEAGSKKKGITTRTGEKGAVVAAAGGSDGEDFTITQGKVGTADEGKTVITASVAPGLLDWLLFTTHEDSFFRRLGRQQQHPSETTEYDIVGGTKIHELKDESSKTDEKEKEHQESAKKRVLPVLVEKVKQVGTNWEKDARQWWHSKAQRSEEARRGGGGQGTEEEAEFLDRQHHLFTGVGQSDRDQDEERHSRRWPRGESWARSESFSQTTVTRPDGTVEHRTVNSINGETETVVKIQHPDGSVEETVTHHQDHDFSRQNPQLHSRHDGQYGGFRDRWAHRRQNQYLYEGEEDRERDAVAAVVAEAIAAEKEAEAEEYQKQQQQQQQQGKSRSWPPKAWTRRQERE